MKFFGFLVTAVLQVVGTAAWAGPAEDLALRDAAVKLDIAAVKEALKAGADPNGLSKDPRPVSPLQAVALGSRLKDDRGTKAVDIAILLFSHGARLGPFDGRILFFPVAEGNLGLIKLFIDRGASPSDKIEGYTPTELALKYAQPDAYAYLLTRGGIPVNESAGVQLTLVEAASDSDLLAMQRAVDAGARINEPDADGRTALLNAVRYPIVLRKYAETVWWILDHGADPNVRGDSGFRGLEGIPLHVFVAMNSQTLNGLVDRRDAQELAKETLRRLLKSGARVSAMDSQGRTPLHIAAREDNVFAAEVLIREGARLMAKDSSGRTPLDYAESAAMIRLLKSNGASER